MYCIFNAKRSSCQCISTLQWPRSLPPTYSEISVWKRILSRIFLINGYHLPHYSSIPTLIGPSHELANSHYPTHSLQELESMLSPLHQALLGEVMFPQDSGEEIAKSIVTEQCLGASDGSVIDNTLASFAVKLCSSSSLKLDDNPNEFSAIGAVDGVSGHI